MRSEDQSLSNKSTRRSRGFLFDNNNWSSDRIIYGCLSSLAKNLPIIKFTLPPAALPIGDASLTHVIKLAAHSTTSPTPTAMKQ
jgi:hypothetical protein